MPFKFNASITTFQSLRTLIVAVAICWTASAIALSEDKEAMVNASTPLGLAGFNGNKDLAEPLITKGAVANEKSIVGIYKNKCERVAADYKLKGTAKINFTEMCMSDVKTIVQNCEIQAAEYKLDRTAETSFIKKCASDAQIVGKNDCDGVAADLELEETAKTRFTRKCKSDAQIVDKRKCEGVAADMKLEGADKSNFIMGCIQNPLNACIGRKGLDVCLPLYSRECRHPDRDKVYRCWHGNFQIWLGCIEMEYVGFRCQ